MAVRALVLTLTLTLATAACRPLGPSTIQLGRAAYNQAILQTNLEAQLLNIVRLRYRDAPMFMELTSVTTSFQFSSSASIGGELESSRSNLLDLGIGASLSESPTITYAPLGGETFVKQLMRPIELDTIVLLLYSGWSLERVLRTCVQTLGNLHNAPRASGPTPSMEPEWRSFVEFARDFETLRLRRMLQLGQGGTATGDETMEVILLPGPEGAQSEEARRMRAQLGVPDQVDRIRLTRSLGLEVSGDTVIVGICTRSLLGVFYYVCHSVEVPQEDVEAGRVTVTRTADGGEFDWNALLAPVMTIRFSESPPKNAYVAVRTAGCPRSTAANAPRHLPRRVGVVPDLEGPSRSRPEAAKTFSRGLQRFRRPPPPQGRAPQTRLRGGRLALRRLWWTARDDRHDHGC